MNHEKDLNRFLNFFQRESSHPLSPFHHQHSPRLSTTTAPGPTSGASRASHGSTPGAKDLEKDLQALAMHHNPKREGTNPAGATAVTIKDEPDFVETHCHWTNCDREFDTQDQLVKVSIKGAITTLSNYSSLSLYYKP